MKSPEGLIWNTPNRRRAFRREPGLISQAEIDLIWEEIEAEEARMASSYEGHLRPRLVLLTPDGPRIETSAGLSMP